MTLTERDRKALILAGVAVPAILIYYFASSPSGRSAAASPTETAPAAEKRLASLRRVAATVPGKDAVMKQLSAELAQREKGLVSGDTAPQAQARLLEVVRRAAKAQTPPLEIGQVEFSEPRSYAGAYAEVALTANMTCRIEQLVNFIAELSSQKELVATSDMHIGAAHAQNKTMPVRLTISALAPKRLIPEKKGSAAF